jgi:hypothetical protein
MLENENVFKWVDISGFFDLLSFSNLCLSLVGYPRLVAAAPSPMTTSASH